MYIKYVILEGFKSYRDRTRIGELDSHFNAITGINGSGKSNILDAVCFVLGLNSLSLMRAISLEELIHKGSGVTRASVSLVFNNEDKRPGKFPVGYEKYDEIIISRTINKGVCRYWLNGVISTKKDIGRMMESVQLNINHPNFVVMQGKIAKVVNMKAKELLGMIEETVGAVAYKARRDKAQRDLDEKDALLNICRKMMEETVLPALKKQQDAADELAEYQLLMTEFTEKKRISIIRIYHKRRQTYERRKGTLKGIQEEDEADNEDEKAALAEMVAAEGNMKAHERGGKSYEPAAVKVEKEMVEQRRLLALREAEMGSAKLNIDDAEEKVQHSEKGHEKEKSQLEELKVNNKEWLDEWNQIIVDLATNEEKLAELRKKRAALHASNDAVQGADGKIVNIHSAIKNVKSDLALNKRVIGVHEEKVEKHTDDLKKFRQEMQTASDWKDIGKMYEQYLENFNQVEAEMAEQNYDIEAIKKVDWNVRSKELEKLERAAVAEERAIKREYQNLEFYYKDNPKAPIDPKSVKGLVYNFIKIKPEYWEKYSWALETALKGFLPDLIVDETEVGLYFTNNFGVIPHRVNVHPMNQWKCPYVHKVNQADLDRKLGKDVAIPAIDMIEYPPEYHLLVQYYVGGKVCVSTPKVARDVAFDHGFYAIAENGDFVDPDGIMDGGLRKDGDKFLKNAMRLRELNEQKKAIQEEETSYKAGRDFVKRYEVAEHQHKVTEKTFKDTPKEQLKVSIATTTADLEKATADLKAAKEEKIQLEKLLVDYEWTKKNLSTIRAKQISENEKEVKQLEKTLATDKAKYEAKKNAFTELNLDIQAAEKMISDYQKDVDAANAELEECKVVMKKQEELLATAQTDYKVMETNLSEAKKADQKRINEMEGWQMVVKNMSDVAHQAEIRRMRRDNERAEAQRQVKAARRLIEEMEKEYPEMDLRNTVVEDGWETNGTLSDLDFLQSRLEVMKTRLDPVRAAMLPTTKAQIAVTQKKIESLLENRLDLIECIKQLDAQKLSMVTEAYDRVNREFDEMMILLLPQSRARLVPVVDNDLSSGLKINVCLDGAWKESLTELSGGQRSLVALAFVLSLARYQPAPFYILDEIDAALDMCHTENIGSLIRERFVDTQFICVSLKTGMYKNANSLFQTHFVNGASIVRRCVPRPRPL